MKDHMLLKYVSVYSHMIFILFFIQFTHMPAAASDPSPLIKAIEVEGLSRISKKELKEVICFKEGNVIDREALKSGIRRAFAKGIFYDIKVMSTQYEDGIILKYIVSEIPVIRKIIIEGNANVSRNKVKKAIFLREGDDLKEKHLIDIRTDLINFYKRRGFPEASVSISAEPAGKRSVVDIHIHIEEGRPLIIRKIDTPDEVKSIIRISEGDIFDIDIVELDLKRLKEKYKKQDYIHPVAGPFEFSDGLLVIPVEKGKRLEMLFKGNEAVNDKKLRAETPFIDDEEISEGTIQEAIDRMKILYKSKGYYHVEVAAGIQSSADTEKITFIIFEGKRVFLKKLHFVGSSFSEEVLKSIIALQEDKPYDEDLVDASSDSILRFYEAFGYLQTDITEIEKKFNTDETEMELTFNVDEGKQTILGSIVITGNVHLDSSEIRNELQLQEEIPYNVIDIGDARYRVISLYNRKGFVDAHVEVKTEIQKEHVFLTFMITENDPSVFGKVIFRGNRKTKAKIIERELTVREGDLFNQDELLKTKQQLYKIGIFSEVSIVPMEPEKRVDGKTVRDILVSLKEGNAGTFDISLGYGDYEKFRTALELNYRNIGGYNKQAGFRTELSSVENKYVFRYREPRFLNIPDLPFNALLIKENTRSVNIDTEEVLYKIDKLSLIVGIEREISKNWKANLHYEYTFTDTQDVAQGVILSREDTGTLGIGSISSSLFYDTRDDPFDPSTGSFHGIVIKVASKALFSETDFIKGTFQGSWFFPLAKKVVFAFSLRGGTSFSYDTTKELPLIERFFLGGRTTVRGYNNDTLGPKGVNDTPTGGNMFVLSNTEFRISLGKGFGLVTFIDAGNVWQLAEQAGSGLKYTVGAGLRYRTPVGPIRVDYGHKMNKEDGESSGEIHFSFGHAF